MPTAHIAAIMPFLQTGISLSNAPLSVLERVAVAADELRDRTRELSDALDADGCATIVSTCNRTELYAYETDVGASLETAADFMQRLADRRGHVPKLDIAPYIVTRTDYDCARHLFTVASGLDSLVRGDAQVASQVRSALHAVSDGSATVNHGLSRLFHAALRTGRRIRKTLGPQIANATVPKAGVALLEAKVGTLNGAAALVIGAGETARLAATELQRRGVTAVTITSRNIANAARLADEIGATFMSIDDIADALSKVNVAVACTASPLPVVSVATTRTAMQLRNDFASQLHILDLGVPRDIEAEVGALAGVDLYTIDDLRAAYIESRGPDIEAAERLVDESAGRFMREWDARNEVRSIGKSAESIRSRELDRTLRTLPNLTETDRAAIDAMTRAIVKSVLAEPIRRLRERDE